MAVFHLMWLTHSETTSPCHPLRLSNSFIVLRLLTYVRLNARPISKFVSATTFFFYCNPISTTCETNTKAVGFQHYSKKFSRNFT